MKNCRTQVCNGIPFLLKRHFHVPCVSLSPPSPLRTFPFCERAGNCRTIDKSFKSSIPFSLSQVVVSFPPSRYCCHYEVGQREENSNASFSFPSFAVSASFAASACSLLDAVQKLAEELHQRSHIVDRTTLVPTRREGREHESLAIKCVTTPPLFGPFPSP